MPLLVRRNARSDLIRRTPPGCWRVESKRTPYRSPGELASPYLSAGLCGDRRSIRRPACWRLFSIFSVFFGARKNGQKTDGQKIDCFRKFGRFRCLRRRFSAILGPKTGLRRVLRTCFPAFFSGRSFASIFRRFFGKKCKISKNEKVCFDI